MNACRIGVILCVLGVLQWTLKSVLRHGSYRYPVGPKPWGVLGNFIILRRLQSQPDRELMRIARRWGDLCLLWAAQYPMLIINKPRIAKELLANVTSNPTLSSCSVPIDCL